MKSFLLGALIAPLLIALAAYVYLSMGYLNMQADATPSSLEARVAMRFLDASVGRRMRQHRNPYGNSEANLLQAIKLYKAHCALCHGAPGHAEANFGRPFYPPAPQFTKEPTDMSEAENFYIIKHGVRWTGMPAWGSVLSDEETWELTSFLSHLPKLPPAAEQAWRKSRPRQAGDRRHLSNGGGKDE
jgi:mono/diheme cytochrome c family protein